MIEILWDEVRAHAAVVPRAGRRRVGGRQLCAARVVARAAEAAGVTEAEVRGSSRRRHCVRPRFAAIAVLREADSAASLSWLGAVFARDHTSILNALRQARALEARDREFAELMQMTREAVR